MSDVTLPDLLGFENWNGIPVCSIGEGDDDYVALGHHDPSATLVAFNLFARNVLGFEDVTDGLVPPELWPPVQEAWAVLKEHCDEFRDPDHDPDCSECGEIEEAGWWLDWGVAAETPDAFPIMIMVF